MKLYCYLIERHACLFQVGIRHDFDAKWINTDCAKKGIMSYYDPTDPSDRRTNRKIMDTKWDDVWTDCNVEDLNSWWNHFGKYCSHIKSKEILQGI